MNQDVAVSKFESKRKHAHAPGREVAFGWQQKKAGEWSRYLIRKCRTCPELVVSDLVWVNLDYDVCAGCLSQDLAPDPLDDALVVCRKCGIRSDAGTGVSESLEWENEDEDLTF